MEEGCMEEGGKENWRKGREGGRKEEREEEGGTWLLHVYKLSACLPLASSILESALIRST